MGTVVFLGFMHFIQYLKVSKPKVRTLSLSRRILYPGHFSGLRAECFSRMLGEVAKRYSHGVKGSIPYGHSPTRASAHAGRVLDTWHVRGGDPTQATIRR